MRSCSRVSNSLGTSKKEAQAEKHASGQADGSDDHGRIAQPARTVQPACQPQRPPLSTLPSRVALQSPIRLVRFVSGNSQKAMLVTASMAATYQKNAASIPASLNNKATNSAVPPNSALPSA